MIESTRRYIVMFFNLTDIEINDIYKEISENPKLLEIIEHTCIQICMRGILIQLY